MIEVLSPLSITENTSQKGEAGAQSVIERWMSRKSKENEVPLTFNETVKGDDCYGGKGNS